MDNLRALISTCLREKTNGYVVEALIAEYPTVQDLMNADEQEFRRVKGIGPVKAKQLKAILDFARAINMPIIDKRPIISGPADVFELMRGEMELLQVEHFAIIALNTKNSVLFREIVSMGSLNASIVHPRETFRRLVKRASASCILVHNHPSGDPTPSTEDITLTRRLVAAGELIDIQVLDHVIIGRGDYVSLKEKGVI